jgi:hypothetical protein
MLRFFINRNMLYGQFYLYKRLRWIWQNVLKQLFFYPLNPPYFIDMNSFTFEIYNKEYRLVSIC